MPDEPIDGLHLTDHSSKVMVRLLDGAWIAGVRRHSEDVETDARRRKWITSDNSAVSTLRGVTWNV